MKQETWNQRKNEGMNYRECYEESVAILKKADILEADLDARLLLENVCHTDRNTLLVHGDRQVTEEEYSLFHELIKKRSQHIPLQHLTGEQFFYGLCFKVNEHVLIPRQDTEILVEQALKVVKPGMKVLDMCTGSGCILITIMNMVKGLQGVGVDYSKEALAVAKENGEKILGNEACDNLLPQWIWSDLFETLKKETEKLVFDVIVSNPPYIATEQIDHLMPEVKEHEPMSALDGREDGLYFYKRIITEGLSFLIDGGYLLFEIGYDQREAVSRLMEEAGYKEIRAVQDYAGLDRVVIGRKKIGKISNCSIV